MSKVIKNLAAVAFAVIALNAEALVVLQQFSLPLGIEHDSNPTLVENNKQSIWLYTASPTYTISAVDNQNRWYGTLGVRLQRSSDKNISVDREDPDLVAGWEKELERGSFKLVGNYNESSTRTTELRTTGLVNQDLTATRKSLAADWTRLLTERLSFALGAELLKNSYDAPSFTGYSTRSLDSSLNYQVNEKLTTFVSAGYIKYKSDSQVGLVVSNTQNSQNYLVGITYLFSPQLDFSVAIGVNHTSSAGSGKLANASFNYSADRHQINGAAGRSVAASGIGDFQESDSYSLGYSYMLSDKSDIGTAFSYQKNNSLNTNETVFLNGFYSRSLSDRWALRLSLDLRKQKTETQTANGEVAGLTLIYNTQEF
jgi:predicted porin